MIYFSASHDPDKRTFSFIAIGALIVCALVAYAIVYMSQVERPMPDKPMTQAFEDLRKEQEAYEQQRQSKLDNSFATAGIMLELKEKVQEHAAEQK